MPLTEAVCAATLEGHVVSEAVAELCAALISHAEAEESFADFSAAGDYVNLFSALGCMLTAGLAAGLTFGVLSLDELSLRVKKRTGTADEIRYCDRLLPLKQWVPRHQLMVTLLLLNAAAAEALPLFLDQLVPPVVAILVSVTAVLIMGEILPTAIFTGPGQLQLASSLAPLVKLMMYAVAPIAYPIGWLLDQLLPDHDTLTSRAEVKALVNVQREIAAERGGARSSEHTCCVCVHDMHMYTPDTHACTHARMHACTHARVRAYVHGCIQARHGAQRRVPMHT